MNSEEKIIEYLKELLIRERRWRKEEQEDITSREVDESCEMFLWEIDERIVEILSA